MRPLSAAALLLCLVAVRPVPGAARNLRLVGDPPTEQVAALAASLGIAAQTPAPDAAEGGWLTTFLAEAGLHEEAFNLPAALHRYRQGCSMSPPMGSGTAWWGDRIAACEGAVLAAQALEDWEALDDTLRAILTLRPAHRFPPARFPPLVAARAGELGSALATGTLIVDGHAGTVLVDGVARGLAPLRLPVVPMGRHRVACGGDEFDVELTGEAPGSARCPAPREVAGPGELAAVLDPTETTWVVAGATDDGMDPGIWVFQGGERPVGLLARRPASIDQMLRWERAVGRVRGR